MEMYKKPIMNIIEMENADVLTTSWRCDYCKKYTKDIEVSGYLHTNDCETLGTNTP